MNNRTAVLLVVLCGTLVFAQEFQIKGDALGVRIYWNWERVGRIQS